MVVGGKGLGALNLDRACDGIHTLEHFVVFSSMVTSLGNEGQSPYGYANTVAEMVCYSRKAVGLPALAIQWGVVDNVGYVAETLKVTSLPLLEPTLVHSVRVSEDVSPSHTSMITLGEHMSRLRSSLSGPHFNCLLASILLSYRPKHSATHLQSSPFGLQRPAA